jgi:hypothetical protein
LLNDLPEDMNIMELVYYSRLNLKRVNMIIENETINFYIGSKQINKHDILVYCKDMLCIFYNVNYEKNSYLYIKNTVSINGNLVVLFSKEKLANETSENEVNENKFFIFRKYCSPKIRIFK